MDVHFTILVSLLLIFSHLLSSSSTHDFDFTDDLLRPRDENNINSTGDLLHRRDDNNINSTGDLLHRRDNNNINSTGDLLHRRDDNNINSTGDLLRRFDDNNINPTTALKTIYNVVVAKDGTGTFKTIKEAILAAPENRKTRYIIYVKTGVYDEIVRIGEKKTYLTLVGDGMNETIITGKLSNTTGYSTTDSATLGVYGTGFMAQDICIRNTAGPGGKQAVALFMQSELSVIYRCKIEGYQDTIYLRYYRQFFRECHISGTIDFICGDSAAVFQYCTIEARLPMVKQYNVLTAQSAKDISRTRGFAFQKCIIKADPKLAPFKKSVKTFLGRPWSNYSTVVFMECDMDDVITPAGWISWNGDGKAPPSTTYYGEYQNKGLGASIRGRIHWPGYHIMHPKETTKFTVSNFLKGDMWLKSTGVPYDKNF